MPWGQLIWLTPRVCCVWEVRELPTWDVSTVWSMCVVDLNESCCNEWGCPQEKGGEGKGNIRIPSY